MRTLHFTGVYKISRPENTKKKPNRKLSCRVFSCLSLRCCYFISGCVYHKGKNYFYILFALREREMSDGAHEEEIIGWGHSGKSFRVFLICFGVENLNFKMKHHKFSLTIQKSSIFFRLSSFLPFHSFLALPLSGSELSFFFATNTVSWSRIFSCVLRIFPKNCFRFDANDGRGGGDGKDEKGREKEKIFWNFSQFTIPRLLR